MPPASAAANRSAQAGAPGAITSTSRSRMPYHSVTDRVPPWLAMFRPRRFGTPPWGATSITPVRTRRHVAPRFWIRPVDCPKRHGHILSRDGDEPCGTTQAAAASGTGSRPSRAAWPISLMIRACPRAVSRTARAGPISLIPPLHGTAKTEREPILTCPLAPWDRPSPFPAGWRGIVGNGPRVRLCRVSPARSPGPPNLPNTILQTGRDQRYRAERGFSGAQQAPGHPTRSHPSSIGRDRRRAFEGGAAATPSGSQRLSTPPKPARESGQLLTNPNSFSRVTRTLFDPHRLPERAKIDAATPGRPSNPRLHPQSQARQTPEILSRTDGLRGPPALSSSYLLAPYPGAAG